MAVSTSTPYLDPLSAQLVEAAAGSPPLHELTIEQIREAVDGLQSSDPVPGVERTSFTVPFEGGVKTWMYRPKGVVGELPYLFYIHGGAWVAGSVDGFTGIVSALAHQTGFAVIFPEYSLAPEVVFPTQQEQCYAVLKWLTENCKAMGLQRRNFAIVGDSAGGHVGAGVNILWQDRKQQIPIKYNVFLSPLFETSNDNKDTLSEFLFFDGPVITGQLKRRVIDLHIPDVKDRESDLGNPALITDEHAQAFPPTLITVSSADPLRSEGEDFGRRLQQAGVDCAMFRLEGQVHDTLVFSGTSGGPTPQATLRMITAVLRERLAGGE
ncbi:Alpha/Beta hydrolase protein [Xylariomycetidae sp. FL2044]|nr:Alpha/Beta hydrolase protein [Xylariomycetidae sp. FL2044]